MKTNISKNKIKKIIGLTCIIMLFVSFQAVFSVKAFVQPTPYPNAITQHQATPYTNVTVQQANWLINQKNPNLVILDVRNQSEYNIGHLYDATLIPVYELANLTATLPASSTIKVGNTTFTINNPDPLSVKDTIVVYCATDFRSTEACQILANNGFKNIYNILGGITAWMQDGYPIDTTYHWVSVSLSPGKTTPQIEPMLLHQESCSACQQALNNPSSPCSSSTSENLTTTFLENTANYQVFTQTNATNGILIDTVERTLLWSYNQNTNGLNRTITLIATNVTSASGQENKQTISLDDLVQANAYNLTLATIINPLPSGTYNSSITGIAYMPTNESGVLSQEIVNFTSSASLSQIYSSLSLIANKLGTNYEMSENPSERIFADRYYTIAEEANFLSTLISLKMSEYNQKILYNSATILDANSCSECTTLCPIIAVLIGVGCGIACILTWGGACEFCIDYLTELGDFDGSCTGLCDAICSLGGQTISDWASGVLWSGSIDNGWVSNPNNILGSEADGKFAELYGGNSGDGGCIEASMPDPSLNGGHVYVQCYSVSGYTSQLLVYVSDDGSHWSTIADTYVTSTSSTTVDCGSTSSTFKYVSVVAYDSPSNGLSANIFADSIAVVST